MLNSRIQTALNLQRNKMERRLAHYLKQAAMRNYFTSIQVKSLVDTVSYRKGKIETAVLLHPRTIDQLNFPHALRSIDAESDRVDILEMVGASIKRKTRKALHSMAQANTATGALAAMAAATRAGAPAVAATEGGEVPPPPPS